MNARRCAGPGEEWLRVIGEVDYRALVSDSIFNLT
jgi:hypothetical protein